MFTIRRLAQQSFLQSRTTALVVSQRNVRATRMIFRTRLPMYKQNYARLPPLTELLTAEDRGVGIESAIDIRMKKLHVYKQYLPTSSTTNLLEALFHCDNDIDRLLTIIDENLVTMNSFYMGLSFETIYDMLETDLCRPETVVVAPEFERLCSKTLYKVRFFEADEILKLLQCLSKLGIPENVLLVQAAFEMARHLINDFNIEELGALARALDRFQPQVEAKKSLLMALKAAVPLARTKQIEEKKVKDIRLKTA